MSRAETAPRADASIAPPADFPPGFLPRGWWIVLLQAARAAHDPRKLLIALAGLLLLLGLGNRLNLPGDVAEGSARPLIPGLPDLLADPRAAWDQAAAHTTDAWLVPVAAFRDVVAPPGAGVRGWLLALLRGLATGAVMLLAGGAISRIAAHDLSGRPRPGLIEARQFSVRHARQILGAPVAPAIGLLVLGLLCAVVGLLFRLPAPFGPVLGGCLAIGPLLLAIPMALIALGLILGWPFMVATVATESEDVLEALSRSYSYVFRRLARFVVLAAVAWVLGTAGWLVAVAVARLIVELAIWGMSLGGPPGIVRALFAGRVPAAGETPALAIQPPRFWQDAVRLLAYAWIFSYFWCVMTSVYFILRRDLDGTPYTELDSGIAPPPPLTPPRAAAAKRDTAPATDTQAISPPAAEPAAPGE